MGRPKGSKNKSTIEKELSSQVETVVNPVDNVDKMENADKIEVEVKHRGKQKEYPKCDRCGKKIYCEPWKIDTNMLTGKAEYWRNIPRRLSVCSECAKELSDLVEKFFLEKGILKKNFEEQARQLACSFIFALGVSWEFLGRRYRGAVKKNGGRCCRKKYPPLVRYNSPSEARAHLKALFIEVKLYLIL